MTDLLDFSDLAQQSVPGDAIATIVTAVRDRSPLLLLGPPGVGKTMIARRIPTLLTLDEQSRRWLAIEHAAWGITTRGGLSTPLGVPFRAPHHTVSAVGLVGESRRAHAITCNIPRDRRGGCSCPGGEASDRISVAGEVTLARFGVLFLDDLIDFSTLAVQCLAGRLRPMGATAPLVVAAVQPCPCGWFGVEGGPVCECPDSARQRYAARLERHRATLSIVASVVVGPIDRSTLRDGARAPSSAELRGRIAGGAS